MVEQLFPAELAQTWQDMVIQSMQDDMVVWKYEELAEKPQAPIAFKTLENYQADFQWRNMELSYNEMTGHAYRPFEEIEYYHFLASKR